MKKGFTLVELLVVLVIIGIIIGLILPNTLRAIEEANAKESASNIRAIDTALQLCYTSERNWETCRGGTYLEDNNYLEQRPVDPFDAGAYTIIIDEDTGGARVQWENHFTQWPPRGAIDLVD